MILLFSYFQATVQENVVIAALSVSRKTPESYDSSISISYCFPFYSFMLAIGRTEIDYFSLDVEGLELEVLRTIPFDKLNIKVLSVEYMHGKATKQEYIDFMISKGYRVHSDLRKCNHFCADIVFVKNSEFPN